MAKQVRIALLGFGIGVLIAILGGIVGGVSIGVILLRALVSGLVAALLFAGMDWVASKFLPDMTGKPADGPDLDDNLDSFDEPNPSLGTRVNVVLPGDDLYEDQATALREQVSHAHHSGVTRPEPVYASENLFVDADSDEGMVEEVPEVPGVAMEEGQVESSFSEEAFYAGIDKLPDIGGFSEHFSSSDDESGQKPETSGHGIAETSFSHVAKESSSSSGKNVDTKLMAQAIRTALKKDDS